MTHNVAAQLALGFLLSAVHYAGELISPKLEKFHSELMSLSAGVFITLLFADLLPLAIGEAGNFSYLLAGFVFFHSFEKYVYQRHPMQFKRALSQIDAAGFFIANFINGFAIVLIYDLEPQLAYLVAIPFVIAELAASAFLTHILKEAEGMRLKLLLSGSVFLGAIAAAMLELGRGVASAIFALVVGSIFYIVIRDMVPRHKEGRLDYFLAGVLAMYFIIFAVK